METRCELGNGSTGTVHFRVVDMCGISESLIFSSNDVQRAGTPKPLQDSCAGDAAELMGCSTLSFWAPSNCGI